MVLIISLSPLFWGPVQKLEEAIILMNFFWSRDLKSNKYCLVFKAAVEKGLIFLFRSAHLSWVLIQVLSMP